MSIYNLSAEKVLLQKIAQGDEYAFRQVFEQYKNSVYSFVLKFVHSKADAEEIVQDTFFTIWQKREKLPEIEHPRNYIYTIVRNKTYDYLNKAARSESHLERIWANMQTEGNSTSELIDFRETSRLIQNGLLHLPQLKQEIFRLSRENGMNHEQIALHIGLSKSRVKNIMVDVLKYLRHYIRIHTIQVGLIAYLGYLSSGCLFEI